MGTSDDTGNTTLGDLLTEGTTVMFTTVGEDGALFSRPMTVQEYADGVLRFVTQRDTHVARDADGRQVNVALSESSRWVSISGTARVVDDIELKRRLWDTVTDAFAEQGPEDPVNVVVEVDPDAASMWDSPGAVGTLLALVKSKVTGETGRPGEQRDLPV